MVMVGFTSAPYTFHDLYIASAWGVQMTQGQGYAIMGLFIWCRVI